MFASGDSRREGRLPGRFDRACRILLRGCQLVSALILLTGHAAGDEFVLAGGARLRGTWLNPDERPIRDYHIETEHGARLTLAATQVVSARHEGDALTEYQRLAPRVSDTIDHQWRLAEWCRERGLDRQREQHLRRVLEHDPNHVAARRGLGYGQLGGKWVLQREVLAERGFVNHDGQWLLTQEVELREERQRVQRAAREWLEKIQRWRKQLSGEEAAAALANLQAIRDPLAISGLTWMLQREPHRRLRILYVDVLGQIDDPRALQILTATALADADIEVFYACLEWIVQRQTPAVVKQLVGVLQDRDPRRINRAAMLLGRLGDDAAIDPLIDALVTTHYVAVPGAANRSPETTTYQFRNDSSDAGSRGTSLVQGQGPTHVPVRIPNQEVLDALVKLGGVSFGFDQRAWRNWRWQQQKYLSEQLDARRAATR